MLLTVRNTTPAHEYTRRLIYFHYPSKGLMVGVDDETGSLDVSSTYIDFENDLKSFSL